MKEKTFIKIDYCMKITSDDFMTRTPCSEKETGGAYYHFKENLVVGGENFLQFTYAKNKVFRCIMMVSRTKDENESADKIYASTKPKGGPRCHKKKPASSTESSGTDAAVPA